MVWILVLVALCPVVSLAAERVAAHALVETRR